MKGFLRRYPPSLFAWLVFVWLMLWGAFDLRIVVFGLIVSAAVLVLFPLPPITSPFYVRPIRLLRLTGFLAMDIVRSSVQVGLDAARHGRQARAAVVAVPVLSDVDHVIFAAANVLSLGPGTFVMQIDRTGRIFYVYVLGVRTLADVSREFEDMVDLQARVVRTFGSSAEIDGLDDLVERAKRDEHKRRNEGAT